METRRFKLSDRLTAEFSLHAAGVDCKFFPCLPARFTMQEAHAYQVARHEMLDRLAQRLAPRPIPGRIRTA